ncbi:MAG: hypothetical protein NZN28_12945 [Meiothermus sp.]|uniref:hypothetical protein n=1 Tax=Meiothermus sp. TaxID=1955249 RepID=UPI0025E51DAF|nr:hypothetical protein [Meiothermus sp.]MCS7069518.1 hypothetical protein [Meiothermus sp.]MCX7739567.1 hypothetical protein [Meiothermus sp.]
MSGIHPGWRAVLLLFSLMVYRSQAEALGPAGRGASSPPPIAASPGLTAGLPGMPPYDPQNVYAFTAAGMLSPVVRDFPERVYVIDGKTCRVVASYKVEPPHMVPACDLRTLYVANDVGNTLISIDLHQPGRYALGHTGVTW